MYGSSYVSPDITKRLKDRLEQIRPFFKNNRGYFPGSMADGSPTNAWLQVRGFENIEIEGSGFTAGLPEGWTADLPFYVLGSSFEIGIRDATRLTVLRIGAEADRSGRIVEATVPAGEYWSANQRSRTYPSSSYRGERGPWPTIILMTIMVVGLLGVGAIARRNQVTFERAEPSIAQLLKVREVYLVNHSSNGFFRGDPYDVTFNVTVDGEQTFSVHCQDGILEDLFCSKRDS